MRMHRSLRDNFQLAMVAILSGCAVLAIAPFAVLRAIRGEWLMATLDAGIVIGMLLLWLITWRSGRARLTGAMITVFYTIGALLIAYLRTEATIYWMYPVFVGNFLMLRPKEGLLLNVAALLAALPLVGTFANPLEFVSVLVTLLLINALVGIFAWRTDDQHRQLHKQARRDPLTALGNRRQMYESFEQFRDSGEVGDTPLSLILFDIDHFKRINDVLGHDAGDQVLCQIAELVRGRLRAGNDEVFRYGGEEFLLLLRDTSLDAAVRVAGDLATGLREQLCTPDGPITASFGCVQRRPQESLETAITRADQALYQAKNAGRDCIRQG